MPASDYIICEIPPMGGEAFFSIDGDLAVDSHPLGNFFPFYQQSNIVLIIARTLHLNLATELAELAVAFRCNYLLVIIPGCSFLL